MRFVTGAWVPPQECPRGYPQRPTLPHGGNGALTRAVAIPKLHCARGRSRDIVTAATGAPDLIAFVCRRKVGGLGKRRSLSMYPPPIAVLLCARTGTRIASRCSSPRPARCFPPDHYVTRNLAHAEGVPPLLPRITSRARHRPRWPRIHRVIVREWRLPVTMPLPRKAFGRSAPAPCSWS